MLRVHQKSGSPQIQSGPPPAKTLHGLPERPATERGSTASRSRISVRRLRPDPEDNFATVMLAMQDLIEDETRHFFINPLGVVVCSEPTVDFLNAANRQRRAWFRQFKQIFGHRMMRNTRAWRDANPHLTKHLAYLHRQQCLTGFLSVHGQEVDANVLSDPPGYGALLSKLSGRAEHWEETRVAR